MKNFKKVLSLALAVLMVMGVVVAGPVTTKADDAKADLTWINGGFYSSLGEITIIANGYKPEKNWIAGAAADFHKVNAMLLEFQPTTGKWVVKDSYVGQEEVVANTVLANGEFGFDESTKVITMAVLFFENAKTNHEASYNFLVANNEVGKEFYLVGDFWTMINDENDKLKDGVALSGYYLTTEEPADYFGKPAPTTPDEGTTTTPDAGTTTPDAGTTTPDAGTTTPEIKDTGDNFVPMFVVLFAGFAMVTVATISKKRRA